MARRFDPDLISATTEYTRLKILQYLAGGKEMCASEIGAKFTLSQPTLSHHLNLLVDNGVLKIRKEGRKVFYSINAARIRDIMDMFGSLCEQKAPASASKAAPAKTAPAKAPAKRAAAKTAAKPAAKAPAKAAPAPSEPVKEDKKKSKKKKGEKEKKKKDKKKKK